MAFGMRFDGLSYRNDANMATGPRSFADDTGMTATLSTPTRWCQNVYINA